MFVDRKGGQAVICEKQKTNKFLPGLNYIYIFSRSNEGRTLKTSAFCSSSVMIQQINFGFIRPRVLPILVDGFQKHRSQKAKISFYY